MSLGITKFFLQAYRTHHSATGVHTRRKSKQSLIVKHEASGSSPSLNVFLFEFVILLFTSRFCSNNYDVNSKRESNFKFWKCLKLKRATTSHVVSQAKRWKKNQRGLQWEQQKQDLPRRLEERRERNAEAHRRAHRDPVRRQQEQERNTAARKRDRLEYPDRRREEQERNTATRRQVCMEDQERRQDEQKGILQHDDKFVWRNLKEG